MEVDVSLNEAALEVAEKASRALEKLIFSTATPEDVFEELMKIEAATLLEKNWKKLTSEPKYYHHLDIFQTVMTLQDDLLSQIEEIKTWMKHGRTLMKDWGMEKKLRPGYRCLFYGPPGTGKTMTACLLGKYIERDVYKIDLSMVVSKYIGETEKNLAKVFDQAETKEWILFFDEADALFGKRTNISDAHDKYANQEVSYLLQRIEDFDGAVILASNMKSNLDDSFTRRFESIINFPMPKPAERLRLWQNGFSRVSTLEDKIKLKQIAGRYELSGGAIINIIRFKILGGKN